MNKRVNVYHLTKWLTNSQKQQTCFKNLQSTELGIFTLKEENKLNKLLTQTTLYILNTNESKSLQLYLFFASVKKEEG